MFFMSSDAASVSGDTGLPAADASRAPRCELILIRGLPGAGKSTMARTEYPDHLHYELDHIFTDCGGRYRFEEQILGPVIDVVHALVDFALARGENTVICGVFTQAKHVDVYRDLAAYHHARFVVRNVLRMGRSVHCVPWSVIRAMQNRWEDIPDGVYEYDDYGIRSGNEQQHK